jgi:hypothetical protein
MPQICVLNQSGADDADVAFACKAVDAQLRHDFCPLFPDVAYQPVAFFASKQNLPTFEGVSLIAIICEDIEVPGAAAYHGVLGQPYIRIDRHDGELSVLLSHEVLEEAADPKCDERRLLPGGVVVAYEVCDPVQGWSYPMSVSLFGETRAVLVSAFVTPAWFSGGPGRRSVNGTTADLGRGELAPGGYLPTLVSVAPGAGSRVAAPAAWAHTFGPRANRDAVLERAVREGSRFSRITEPRDRRRYEG